MTRFLVAAAAVLLCALAVMAFMLAAQRKLYERKIRKAEEERDRRLSAADGRISEVLRDATEKKNSMRGPDGRAFAASLDVLRGVADGDTAHSPPDKGQSGVSIPIRRRRKSGGGS